MARLLLSDAHDWHLKFPDDQDVRGFRALDADRNDTGRTVDDMVIDTDAEMVSHVLLSDGTDYPARDLSIGDGVVYLTGGQAMTGDADDVRPGVTVFEDGHIVRREAIEGADASAFDSDFRQHHAQSHGASGRMYDDDAPAYQYGYSQATGAHAGRSYGDAETDLRSGYASGATAGRDYDADRDAVQYGYGRAMTSGRGDL